MAKIDQNSESLNSDIASIVEQHMERLLCDVFRLMFKLNLVAVPKAPLDKENSVGANFVLRHEKLTACVSFRIMRSAALLVAERLGIRKRLGTSAVLQQDVAREIVNIVGNNLRTALSQDLGIRFEFDVYPSEVEISNLGSPISFNMDFQITPDMPLSLSFICGTKEPESTLNVNSAV